MIMFNGMMALGSAAWGFVASLVGIPWALVASAACLFAFDMLTMRWRLPGDEAPPAIAIGEPIRQGQGE